jgi:hypothetical protein
MKNIAAGLFFGLVFFGLSAQSGFALEAQIKNSNVCMMNNEYMGSEQTPVPVEGRTYYGCCKGCAANLERNAALRSAKDPYSGEQVDKVDAYIVLEPGSAKNVLYFKLEENYKNWLALPANAPNMSVQPEDQSR